MEIEKTPSIKINTYLPSFMQYNSEEFSLFLKYYFEWLEQYGPVKEQRNILDNTNIDITSEFFLKFLKNEFMQDIPVNDELEQRVLIKNIKDFYRAKGSEKAYKLLFRILFNEDVDFYYPAKDILRASDGRWVVERSVKVDLLAEFDSSKPILLEGSVSSAVARLERIENYIESNQNSTEIFLSYISENEFVVGEVLKDKYTNINLANVKTVITYPGAWLGTYGFLSSDKYLQDNFYYQEFSYVLKTSRQGLDYKDYVNQFVHPAGTMMFSALNINEILDISQYTSIIADYKYPQSFTLDESFAIDISSYSEYIEFNENNPGGDYGRGKYKFEITIDFGVPDSFSVNYPTTFFDIQQSSVYQKYLNYTFQNYLTMKLPDPQYLADPMFNSASIGVVGSSGSLWTNGTFDNSTSLNVDNIYLENGYKRWITMTWQASNATGSTIYPRIILGKIPVANAFDVWKYSYELKINSITVSSGVTGNTFPTKTGNKVFGADALPVTYTVSGAKQNILPNQEIVLDFIPYNLDSGKNFTINFELSDPLLTLVNDENTINNWNIMHFQSDIGMIFSNGDNLIISSSNPTTFHTVSNQISNSVVRMTKGYRYKYINNASLIADEDGPYVDPNIVSLNEFSLGTGTLSLSANTRVTGTGTVFSSEIIAGDVLYVNDTINSANTYLVVSGVIDDTTLEIKDPYFASTSGATFNRIIVQ